MARVRGAANGERVGSAMKMRRGAYSAATAATSSTGLAKYRV